VLLLRIGEILLPVRSFAIIRMVHG
jgi:hypothetical protein